MSRRRWILFVSRRWFASRRESGGSASSFFAASGIAIGVAALIVVLGVMNGFQLGFIDSILEIASFHVRVEADRSGGPDEALAARIAADPAVRSVLPFAETRCLARSPDGRSQAIELRALPSDAARRDPALLPALGLEGPLFPPGGGIVIGTELARQLDLRPGQFLQLLVVTASAAEGVEAKTIRLRIAGIFRSGYYDYDAGLAFLPFSEAGGIFPETGPVPYIYGIKLKDRYADAAFVERLHSVYGIPNADIESWRDYNRAFFGALRTEKSLMMLLIGLIFLVVGVNIYHAMRRTVAERMEDIAVLRALGSRSESVRWTFMLDGLAIGAGGALAGLIVGLFIAVNVNDVFSAASALVNGAVRLLAHLRGVTAGGNFQVFSPQYFYLVEVPVRILFPETLFIFAAAVLSAVLSAGIAAKSVSRLEPAAVLRYE
ncbi:MAG TPA: ABC transporter permease [Rectinemataceae bacterium]|nr:ABC transporter permease [Rectinemataceae bacterium]